MKLLKNKIQKLKIKLNNLENKFSDATTSIQIHQYNTDKQNLEKRVEDVDKKY